MDVNVTFLGLKFNEDTGHIGISLRNTEIDKKYEDEGRSPWPVTTYMTMPEARWAVDCLRGQAPFYPFFDDIGYHTQFSTGGIRVWRNDGGKVVDMLFCIPGEAIADWFATFLDSGLPQVEFNVMSLRHIREHYAPRPVFDIQFDVLKSLCKNIDTPRLDDALISLTRIAKNHSHGDGGNMTLHLSFDWGCPSDIRPDSYYFWFETPQGQQFMNGGVVCHGNEDRGFEYSIHT